jgi:hypothetical protein
VHFSRTAGPESTAATSAVSASVIESHILSPYILLVRSAEAEIENIRMISFTRHKPDISFRYD